MAISSKSSRRSRAARLCLATLLVGAIGGGVLWYQNLAPLALTYSTEGTTLTDDVAILVDCRRPETMLIRYVQNFPVGYSPSSHDLPSEAHERTLAVFEFDRETSQLRPCDDEAWNRAEGERCRRNTGFLPGSGLSRNAQYALTFRGKTIPTAGRTVLAWEVSADGRYAAVLSAIGRLRDSSWIPFFGPKWAGGTHFHELFDFPSMKRLGTPVRLPLVSRKGQIIVRWAPCSAYVLYTPLSYEKVCIIPVESETEMATARR